MKQASPRASRACSFDANELWTIGERIVTMERLYNLRCGALAEDDRLPVRFTERDLESLPGGGVVELEGLRQEFYALMGWSADGVPTADTLGAPRSDEAGRVGVIFGVTLRLVTPAHALSPPAPP